MVYKVDYSFFLKKMKYLLPSSFLFSLNKKNNLIQCEDMEFGCVIDYDDAYINK